MSETPDQTPLTRPAPEEQPAPRPSGLIAPGTISKGDDLAGTETR